MVHSLQACRAAAAALVVLFHLGGTFAQDKYFGFKALDGPFAWADAGVEFFFVLSGFLIATVHRGDFGQPRAIGGYGLKRGLRIYPTYWLISAAVCLAALAVPSLRDAIPSDPWTIVKTFALIPQDPAVVGGTGAPILFVAWSLQYELVFYAVVAAFIASRAAGLLAVAGLVAAHLGCRFGASCGFPLSFFGSNLVLLFAMGVACAYIVPSRFRIPQPLFVAVAALAAFVGVGAFEVVHGRDTLPIDRRLVYGVVASIAIVALAQAEAGGKLVLRQRWLAILGDSSYALYLLHIPIISLLCKLALKLGLSGPIAIVMCFIAIFLACVLAAAIFYQVVERPMLRRLRALAGRKATPEAAAPAAVRWS